MRHQCSTCLGEFFDDTPSSSPPQRVFCVFCGMRLPPPRSSGTSAAPDAAPPSRAAGAPPGADSLMPVHDDEPGPGSQARGVARRLGRFWPSLAVGFGVGAVAAVLFAERASWTSTSAVAVSAPQRDPRPVAPAVALPGCAAPSATAALAPPLPPSETKPTVTPVLEKRFWLERARSAQRQYRLSEAERFYRRALTQAPKDSEALAGLGELELLRGERAAADARFREALEANADYVPARVALADLHWQFGQAEDARREYRDIVEQYGAELFPPYVNQRLEGDACVPRCGEAGETSPSTTPRSAP
jgi:Tetratricopeptide repeat